MRPCSVISSDAFKNGFNISSEKLSDDGLEIGAPPPDGGLFFNTQASG